MLSKESAEYIENGHYQIGGEDWMSIWTFKNKRNIGSNNTRTNGEEGRNMTFKYENIATKPDFGNFDEIKIFKVTDLEEFINY